MKKRTKILATIGPASDSLEQITALMRAGVNVFRLNFSHGTHQYHSEVLARIRKAIEETGLVTGILQDISGPKIRVGLLNDDFYLKQGDTLKFCREEIEGTQTGTGEYKLSISENRILDQLKLGDAIYMCDGIIRAKVTEITEQSVSVIVENDGKLSSRKGVNFPNTHLGIDVITAKDERDIKWGVENEVDFMAISFVQEAKDMITARNLIKKYGGTTQIFAKIEKFDAIENIDEILEASDGLMVARGDLGIEIPYYKVPTMQKMLISKANNKNKPVITATQMLLSMTTHETATRAEISDVANAVFDGTDAVMLSEESAVGHNPVLAVETMANTIKAAEEQYPFHKFSHFDMFDADDNIDESAVRLAHSMNASGIISMTTSGQSAKKVARYRPSEAIYAVTHDKRAAQSLTIVWGVVPSFSVKRDSLGQMIADVMQEGRERGLFAADKTYILTAGDPVGMPGSTNLIRVIKGDEDKFFL